MRERRDENDDPQRTSGGPGEPTTPYGTPQPSQPTAELYVSDLATRDIAYRFELLAELGRGGMGIVYRARDRETGEIVALKVLKPEIANRPDLIDRFKTELRLARKITHKNVCRSYDLHRFGETVVIAMEYVEGESLRAVLNRPGGVSLRIGMRWASQICHGLAEAHAQGIVHRDLKPENIVIDHGGQAKVMDFGIARSVDTATVTAVIAGTPAYMSPEQAEGKPADARSDIYSLGLIFYEMFTGQQGLKAESPIALVHKQIHETPPPPQEVEPDLPLRIDRAIRMCLEKKPEKRFQSVTELEAALTERPEAKPGAAGGEKVELPAHLAHWQRSDWLLVAAAIAGLALFFPFFNRTNLAPRSKVSFDRSVLQRIAEEYAEKLGAPLGRVDGIDCTAHAARYDYIAEFLGARSALKFANDPIPYWSWGVHWESGTQIRVDNRGALQYFSRDFPIGAEYQNLSVEEARPLAEKTLKDFFECDPSLLQLKTAASETSSGPAATVFKWVDPRDYGGLKQHYEARLVGRAVALLSRSYGLVDNWYDWGNFYYQMLAVLVISLPAIAVGFAQRRHVDPTARWRILLIVAMVADAEWLHWPAWSDILMPQNIIFLLALCIGITVSVFWGSVVIERSVRRVAPAKFLSLIPGLDAKGAASQAFGLGILRGTFVGLALLGLDSFLVWAGTSRLPVRLDSMMQIMLQPHFLYRPWPTVAVALLEFWQVVIIAGAIVFITSSAARLLRRAWMVVLVPAALVAMILPGPLLNMGAVQPYHWKVVLLFIECLGLALCYTRFDVLTTAWAVFTFAFCWENYHLLVMFEPAGNAEQWAGFAVLGLFILGAAAIAFQSALQTGYRRLAATFE